MPKVLGVLRQRRDLLGAFRIGVGQAAVGGRHVVVDDGQRLVRRVHLAAGGAQAFEGLRRGDLMHQMAVDIDEAGAVRLLVDQMVVPDLVVEGTRFHDVELLLRVKRIAACRRLAASGRDQSPACTRRQPAENRPGRRAWSSRTIR